MSSPKDFSADLAAVSKTVKTDVDTIIKLVRQKDARGGDSSTEATQPDENVGSRFNERATTSSNEPPSQMNRRKPAKLRTTNESLLTEQVVLENVTTRLRRDTNELLTEAALRQKLKKEVPATRQDIIEAALQDWFRRHGYGVGSPRQ